MTPAIVEPINPITAPSIAAHPESIARTLSPAELQEVARFGIHDDEVFREIAERTDGVPTCEMFAKCTIPAVARLRMNCCGIAQLGCGPCLDRHRGYFTLEPGEFVLVTCRGCQQRAIAHSLDDIATVVPL